MGVEGPFTFAEYRNEGKLCSRIDNIYQPTADGGYIKLRNDFHLPQSIRKDLSADRVMFSKTFVYFGERAPRVPPAFQEFVYRGRGHKVFGTSPGEPDDARLSGRIRSFVRWAFSRGRGRVGGPFDGPWYNRSCCS